MSKRFDLPGAIGHSSEGGLIGQPHTFCIGAMFTTQYPFLVCPSKVASESVHHAGIGTTAGA